MLPLLERTNELAVLESAARGAALGEGATVAVTAGAGLGKTSLLRAALQFAEAHGLHCAYARAGELERDLGWGVAVDLIEAVLCDVAPATRSELLSGRARPAATVLSENQLESSARAAAARVPAIVAALTLVVIRLAAQRPLAIVVDDLHWADGPSLRWLCHLAARVEHSNVLLVIASRPHEPGASALLAALDAAASLALAPAPLTASATTQLIDVGLDGATDAATNDAVHAVTAGNPFLIDQLMRHLESGPVDAAAVWNARPERLATLVLARLARLGRDARRLSEAVAVLGVDSALRDAAALAGIERSAAARAAARLADTGFFNDSLPLSFAHPLLREVVKDGLSAAHADELRRGAARMLASGDADPTAAGVHLLAAEPVGEPWAASLLNAAGHREMRRAA